MIDKYKKLIIKILIGVLIISCILVYFFVKPIKSVINLVMLSFVIAYVLKPIRDWLIEKFRLNKQKSALLIIMSCFIIFTGLIYFIIPTIINESKNFGLILDNLEEYILSMASQFNLDQMSIFQTAYIQINEKINMFLASIGANLLDNIVALMENLIAFAVVPVVSYYFLSQSDVIYNKVLLLLPTKKRVIVRKINENIDKVLSRYIISQLVLSLIIGVLTFILLIILQIRFPLVLALLNAIVNIIPYFGPVIGGIPIVFIALLQSPGKAILALIGAFIIQQIEGDLLAPKITGDSTNLHPIIIIILLILGEKIGGLVGMVIAVPIVVIIKVIYDDINYYLF